MFYPGNNITTKPEYKYKHFRTYKVNSITQDGHYDLTELDYKTLKPILDENNYENNIISDKDFIEREFQPLMEGGRRKIMTKTRKTRKTRKQENINECLNAIAIINNNWILVG